MLVFLLYLFLLTRRKMGILLRILIKSREQISFSAIMFLSVFSVFSGLSVNAQEKKKISDALKFETRVTGDFVSNFFGGIRKGTTYIGIETLSMELDTRNAGLWKNGTILFSGLNAHGRGPSSEYTGDLQMISNIESGDYTGIYEMYYLHRFSKFSILAGLHDLNSEFAGTKYGGTFINSSFGISPNISLNIPVSIYPVIAPAIVMKYELNPGLTLKFGIYDGDPGDFESNRYNLEWSLGKDQGALTVGELQFSNIKSGQVTGIYRIGLYSHTGFFTDYTDTISLRRGNRGLFIVADQALFSRSLSAARGLCFFIQAGIAPEDINMVQYYLGGGLRYHGIIPYRYYDELGIAFAMITLAEPFRKVNPGSLKNEIILEATYRFQFGRNYSIQPSMQYIINPGASTEKNNSLAGIIRFKLGF